MITNDTTSYQRQLLQTPIPKLSSPEWKRYVTIVMQTSKLHDIHFDQLYEYIEQNKEEAKEVRAERVSKHHDLLALVAHAYTAP
ncbi:hypothetical protein Tco_1039486 [Tanacetum coccineum]